MMMMTFPMMKMMTMTDDDDDDDEDDLPNLLSHGVILVPHVKLENVSLMANLVGNNHVHIILKTNMMISHIF